MLGPVFGPPLGGFIVTYFSWRWIFFINVPIALLGIILVTLFVDNLREENIRPIDWRGFVARPASACLASRSVSRSSGRGGVAGRHRSSAMIVVGVALLLGCMSGTRSARRSR